ncbi:hypothetical protein [Anaerotignum sp.]|uniref:hypothetical protein n=1 Tax=Anaerotignum sp. TaxID=2039241 RepID=UPI0027152A60|nr:hypothetical protein [Anaerotignum sp.]
MKKNIAKLLLCTVCVLSISAPAYAKEIPNQTAEETQISTRAHEMETKYEKIGKPVRKTYDLGAAGGQLPEGTRFVGGTGKLIWEDGGESTSFSVSIGGVPIGFALSIGTATSGVGGKGIDVPADGHYYKLGVERTVEVTGYKVYERLAGSSLPWKYVGKRSYVREIDETFYLLFVK